MSKSPAVKKKVVKAPITPDIEKEVSALLASGAWKEVPNPNKDPPTYFFNTKDHKETTYDLKQYLADKKAKAAKAAAPAAGSAAAPVAAAASSPQKESSATSEGGEDGKSETSSAKKPLKKVGAKASKASKADSEAEKQREAAEEEEERQRVQQDRESEIREQGAKETAAAVERALAEVKAAADMERKLLADKEAQLQEREVRLEEHRNKKLRDLLKYTDPLDRLVEENNTLQQMLVSGSTGHVSLDFQAKYDALLRTNNALTVQMARMKSEYDAMQKALTDANFKIHQQDLMLKEQKLPSGRTRDEELQVTMNHLREQNRELVQQVGELTLFLARGLNEVAYRDSNRASQQNLPLDAADEVTIVSRMLDSQLRQVLCTNCASALTKLRDQSIPMNQSTIGHNRNVDLNASGQQLQQQYEMNSHQGSLHSAQYTSVADYGAAHSGNSYTPHSQGIPRSGAAQLGVSNATVTGGLYPQSPAHPQSPQAQSVGAQVVRQNSFAGASRPPAGGSSTAPQQGGNGIMYGGFVLRNPKAGY